MAITALRLKSFVQHGHETPSVPVCFTSHSSICSWNVLPLKKKKIIISASLQQSAIGADVYIPREKCFNGVKALVDEGIKKIPDAYVLPPLERPCNADLYRNHPDLPLIDMNDAEGARRPLFVAAIADACEKWGFFQLINHRVSAPVIQRMMAAAREFFYLPLEEKMFYASDDVAKTRRIGATRVGTSFNPYKETTLEWRDHLRHPCTPLPDIIQNWPRKPTHYRQAALDYALGVRALAEQLLLGISESLGVCDGSLMEKFNPFDQQLAVNYYPRCPNPDLTVGLSSHSDPGGITILLQDDVGGLQVLHENRWVDVQPFAGSLIVNVGDQMEILSNGKYKSMEHRAIVNSKRARMSIISSYNPSRDTKISPLKHLVDDLHQPALYRETLYADYLQHFYSKGLDRKSCIRYVKYSS